MEVCSAVGAEFGGAADCSSYLWELPYCRCVESGGVVYLVRAKYSNVGPVVLDGWVHVSLTSFSSFSNNLNIIGEEACTEN